MCEVGIRSGKCEFVVQADDGSAVFLDDKKRCEWLVMTGV